MLKGVIVQMVLVGWDEGGYRVEIVILTTTIYVLSYTIGPRYWIRPDRHRVKAL